MHRVHRIRAVVAVGTVVAAVLVVLASGVAGAAGHHVQLPPVHGVFSYQIGGAFAPEAGVQIVDRDRHARPAAGHYNVCYVNAFQAQTGEHKWWRAKHSDLLLTKSGHPVIDPGWNEQLLDTSTAAKRAALAQIIGGWMEGCARHGFQAVEPDNLDSWSRSKHRLTIADNLAFAALLAKRAHRAGLAIAQKNAAGISMRGKKAGFDFAIAEECQAYTECDKYMRAYSDHVIEIEYPDNGGVKGFDAACRARGHRISIVYRDRDVLPAGKSGFLEQHCASAG
jgi:hypothetical protein